MTRAARIAETRVACAVKAARAAGLCVAGIEFRPDGTIFVRHGEPLDKESTGAEHRDGLDRPEDVLARLREWAS